jgi:hypothetical protein
LANFGALLYSKKATNLSKRRGEAYIRGNKEMKKSRIKSRSNKQKKEQTNKKGKEGRFDIEHSHAFYIHNGHHTNPVIASVPPLACRITGKTAQLGLIKLDERDWG